MGTDATFATLVDRLLAIVNVAVSALFGIVFVYIMWKVIEAWIINGGDPAKRQEGRQLALVGVLVLVLMLVTWGIVALLRTALFG
jgi:hypothetical protein